MIELKISSHRKVLILIGLCAMMIGNVWADTLYGDMAGKIRYVKQGATGMGTSWADASGDLQQMIRYSIPGDLVYVAEGIYYAAHGDEVADERGTGTTLRQRSFVMKDGVQVYGGFKGIEGETPDSRERKATLYGWQLKYSSVLTGEMPEGTSGRINDEWNLDTLRQYWNPRGYIMDNSLHVVWFAVNGFSSLVEGEATTANNLRYETVLDGFTVEGGAADGNDPDGGIQGHSARFGGGVYLVGNGVLRNCVIHQNYAQTRGGGVFFNNGGRASDCFITRNCSPGLRLRNGFGGGVYILSKGLVERSFVVNNSARLGGGMYLSVDRNPLPYEITVEMSVVANNTAFHEAGGIYCDRAGVLTGLMIARNRCMDAGFTGFGKTGGIYCDHYAVLTNTALYGNEAAANKRQGYGTNITPANSTQPASLQLIYCALQNMSGENFGFSSLTEVMNIDENIETFSPWFKRDPQKTGLLLEGDNPYTYLALANWDKDECSVFIRKGATPLEAPFLSGSLRVNVPLTTIIGDSIRSRHDIGPYICGKANIVAGKGIRDGKQKRVVYVDNLSKVCGDGSSWNSPTKLLGPAIDYIEETGGGEVWVKEGEFIPSYSVLTHEFRSFCLLMKSGVEMYGGFPRSKASPLWEDRNPVAYRTIINGDLGKKGDHSDNSYHIVAFEKSLTRTAVLDGFNLINANSANDLYHEDVGAVRINTPYAVLRNCMISNSIGRSGAAVAATVPFLMENCVINNNEASEGAVVDVPSQTQLVNVTVGLNKGDGIKGGKILNTLVWGNTGNQITGNATVSYSAVEGGFPGVGNIKFEINPETALPDMTNPTLTPGVIIEGYGTLTGGPAVFEPTCLSSVVNTGTFTGAPLTDIAGRSRTAGGAVDIGAYQSTCLPDGGIKYVKQGAAGRGTSWADASGDLQKMVNEALPGEQVWVAAGNYRIYTRAYDSDWKNPDNFLMKEGVDVYGGFPDYGTPGMKERRPVDLTARYRTVLEPMALADWETDSRFPGRVLGQRNDFSVQTTWDGFTVQNGRVSINDPENGGAGAKLLKKGRLVNCYIVNNINEVRLDRNDAGSLQMRGGGVHCRGGMLVNCYIINNEVNGLKCKNGSCKSVQLYGEAYGGGIYMTSGTAYNCVIARNYCSGVYADGSGVFVEQADFYNNTIVNNSGKYEGGGRTCAIRIGTLSYANLSITNCIVYGNDGIPIIDEGGNLSNVRYSCFSGHGGVNGNIDVDPLFTGENDFHLRAGSLAINAGIMVPAMPSKDMDYTDRVKDCAVDMGAYEFGGENEGTININTAILPGSGIVFVTKNGSGRADGSSWQNAACENKLQRAIDVLSEDRRMLAERQVWVATGTDWGEGRAASFYPVTQKDPQDIRTRSFFMKPGVDVIGHFFGNEKSPDERVLGLTPRAITILDGNFNGTDSVVGDDSYHVVEFNTDDKSKKAVLQDFIIRRGNADHYNVSTYQNGGGVVIKPGGIVRNCYIEQCRALKNGGGVYLTGNGAALTGSVVADNVAGKGGGVYAGQNTLLTGNTIVSNTADQGGGATFEWPSMIQACVLWHNIAGNGKNIYGDTETPYMLEGMAYQSSQTSFYAVNFCAIEEQTVTGISNLKLSTDNDAEGISPGFLAPDYATFGNGGWSLKNTSSLIDRGINTSIKYFNTVEDILKVYSLGKKDMAGRDRIKTVYPGILEKYMDIGAYEATDMVELNPQVVDGRLRFYITRVARGKMDGSSWRNGMDDIQVALNYLKSKKIKGEIWVQGGYTYRPFRPIEGEEDIRAMSFVLNQYADLYGGFKGDPEYLPGGVSETRLSERVKADRNGNDVIEEYEFKYETTLDGAINPVGDPDRNAYHVLYYNEYKITDMVVLDGITVINGQGMGGKKDIWMNGAGLYTQCPVTIRNCVFRNNYAGKDGGAVYAADGIKIENSSFEGNMASGDGGAVWMVGGSMANSNVFNNTAMLSGGGIMAISGAKLMNLTVVRNKANEGGGIYVGKMGEVTNTVVWGNEGKTQIKNPYGGVVSYCAVQNDSGLGSGDNIRLDADNRAAEGPDFINPSDVAGVGGYVWTADWTLHTLSHLVDRGNSGAYRDMGLPEYVNSILYTGSSDPVPVARVQGSAIDVGSYENAAVRLNRNVDTLYVRTWEDRTGVADGSSWKQATADLQAAIETLEQSKSSGNKQIWVAQGDYIPLRLREGMSQDIENRSFVVTKGGVKIYGGFPDDRTGSADPGMEQRNPERYVTTLDGTSQKTRHIIYVSGEQPLLINGFTIRGGCALGNGEEGKGAGIYIHKNSGTVIIDRCLFTNNQASGNGGALYSTKMVYVWNSLFFNNRTVGANLAHTCFLNNTVVRNTVGGLICEQWESNDVRNSVFWGNGGDQVSGIQNLKYCAVQGRLPEGEGNKKLSIENESADGPMFRDPADLSGKGYELNCGSVLANVGDNSVIRVMQDIGGIGTGLFDIVNKSRMLFGRIDMGAFESVLGSRPEKPFAGYNDTVRTCQNAPVELTLSGDSAGKTKIYWLLDGVDVGENNVRIAALLGGDFIYEVVRVDSTGCYSQPDSVNVKVFEALRPEISTTPEICSGENVTLAFTPRLDYIYTLWDNGNIKLLGYELSKGGILITVPSEGSHIYRVTGMKYYGYSYRCESEASEQTVIVHPAGNAPDGVMLKLISAVGTDDSQQLCQGENMIPVSYEVIGVESAEVMTTLPVGVTGGYNMGIYTLSGKPEGTFSYIVRTLGNSVCTSARAKGIVIVNDTPGFEFGE